MSIVQVKGTGKPNELEVSVDNANSPVVGTAIKPKIDKIKALRKEANRLVSMANKRLRRLEKNDLTNTPAYQAYIKQGGKPFSTKGKNYNELQHELARLRNFIDSQTSTVKGVNQFLKDIANNTGIKYKNLKDLRQKADKFFELSSKIEQYLRNVHDVASAISYQKIWEQINVYVKDNKLDLSQSKLDLDGMIEVITQAILEYDKPVTDNLWLLDGEYTPEVNDEVAVVKRERFKIFLTKDE